MARTTRPGVQLYRPAPPPRKVNEATEIPAGVHIRQVSLGSSGGDDAAYRASERAAERQMEAWAAHRASGAYSGDFFR